jgi:hypothetical protein
MILVAEWVIVPEFGSPAQIILNLLGMLLWLVVAAWVIARWRRGHSPTGWDLLAIIASVWIGGVFVPIGPAVWLIVHARGASRDLRPIENVKRSA